MKILKQIVLIVTGSLIMAPVCNGAAGSILTDAPVNGVENAVGLGYGIDLNNRKSVNMSPFKIKNGDYTPTTLEQSALEVKWSGDMTAVESQLQVDTSAGASYGPLSAGAKMNLDMSSASFGLNKTFIMVLHYKKFKRALHPPVKSMLNKSAIGLSENYSEFFDAYGNGYMADIDYGARIVGVINFEFSSIAESLAFGASMNASGGTGVFNAEAAASLKSNETLKNSAINVSFKFAQAGGDATSLFKNLQSLGFKENGSHEGRLEPMMGLFEELSKVLIKTAADLNTSTVDDAKCVPLAFVAKEYPASLFVDHENSRLSNESINAALKLMNETIINLKFIKTLDKISTYTDPTTGTSNRLLPSGGLIKKFATDSNQITIRERLYSDTRAVLTKTSDEQAKKALKDLQSELKSSSGGYAIDGVSFRSITDLVDKLRKEGVLSFAGETLTKAVDGNAKSFMSLTASGKADKGFLKFDMGQSEKWLELDPVKVTKALHSEAGAGAGMYIGGGFNNPAVRYKEPWSFHEETKMITGLYPSCQSTELQGFDLGYFIDGYPNRYSAPDILLEPGKSGVATSTIRVILLQKKELAAQYWDGTMLRQAWLPNSDIVKVSFTPTEQGDGHGLCVKNSQGRNVFAEWVAKQNHCIDLEKAGGLGDLGKYALLINNGLVFGRVNTRGIESCPHGLFLASKTLSMDFTVRQFFLRIDKMFDNKGRITDELLSANDSSASK